jgi:hypothetical protein
MRILFVALLGLAVLGAARHARASEVAVAALPVTTTPTTGAPARTPGKDPAKAAPDRARDRLQLDSTAITGNRELPKVMSIVPWKGAEPAAGPDRPMGSLIDELLMPLDRDEFKREITYYRDLTTQSVTPTTLAPPEPSKR